MGTPINQKQNSSPTSVEQYLKDAPLKRVVIKLGSALLFDQNNNLRATWLAGLCKDIAALCTRGSDVVIVSSGAIALGRTKMGLETRPKNLSQAQAAAAIGQVKLINAWQNALKEEYLDAAQWLLTLSDLENRRTYLNARATAEELLNHKVLPIINENDTTATKERRFGDNDRLAARVGQVIGADLVILLSDVDGLYTANPNDDDSARFIPIIDEISPQIEAMAGSEDADGVGSGGMRTKIKAAQIATESGAAMIIASGHVEHPIKAIFEGGKASLFRPTTTVMDARRLWISGRLHIEGSVIIDQGAENALFSGSSLLPAGVIGLEGVIRRGDIIAIKNTNGITLAQGLSAYDGEEIQRILGCQSQDILELLGYDRGDVIIHRDDLVMKERQGDIE